MNTVFSLKPKKSTRAVIDNNAMMRLKMQNALYQKELNRVKAENAALALAAQQELAHKQALADQQQELARQQALAHQQQELARQQALAHQQQELARQQALARHQELARQQEEVHHQQELARQQALARKKQELMRQQALARQQEEVHHNVVMHASKQENNPPLVTKNIHKKNKFNGLLSKLSKQK
jgi:hypothetical protein